MDPAPLKEDLLEPNSQKPIISRVWQRWFHAIGKSGYISRGDPSDWDFTLASFTTDGTVKSLSLSSIIGTGVKLVHLRGAIQDGAVDNYIQIYAPSQSNANNSALMITRTIDQIAYYSDLWVKCNSAGAVSYLASNTTFTGIWLLVRGWWIL